MTTQAPRVLVVGASGKVGSACTKASLARGYETIGFLRTPGKLPPIDSANFKVAVGDAKDSAAVRDAIRNGNKPVTAVILTAPMGDMRGRRSGYEEILKSVCSAVKEENSNIKLWVMAGAAILETPQHPGKPVNSLFPLTFYPEYEPSRDWLQQNASDVDWTMNCPALIKDQPRIGPFSQWSETVPDYSPTFLSSLPYIGLFVDVMKTWIGQKITFEGLADFMLDNIHADGKLKGKTIGVLERPS